MAAFLAGTFEGHLQVIHYSRLPCAVNIAICFEIARLVTLVHATDYYQHSNQISTVVCFPSQVGAMMARVDRDAKWIKHCHMLCFQICVLSVLALLESDCCARLYAVSRQREVPCGGLKFGGGPPGLCICWGGPPGLGPGANCGALATGTACAAGAGCCAGRITAAPVTYVYQRLWYPLCKLRLTFLACSMQAV